MRDSLNKGTFVCRFIKIKNRTDVRCLSLLSLILFLFHAFAHFHHWGFFSSSLVLVDTVLFYISLKISSPTYYLLRLYYDTTFFPFFQVDFFAIGLIDKIMENQLIGKDLIHCNLHSTRDQYKNKRKNMSRDLSFYYYY